MDALSHLPRPERLREFTCTECGGHVVRFAGEEGDDTPVCRPCQFIAERALVSDAEREAVREPRMAEFLARPRWPR